tara:strand:- start:3684 stop:3896 length:213 start_codon:yes stop_codon:yes gene_type:complete
MRYVFGALSVLAAVIIFIAIIGTFGAFLGAVFGAIPALLLLIVFGAEVARWWLILCMLLGAFGLIMAASQ